MKTSGATPMRELIRRWRHMADGARDLAPAVASAYERVATELENEMGANAEQLLTLAQASRESGYTADHLGRLIRAARLANHGRRNAPRVRRGDVPAKHGASAA